MEFTEAFRAEDISKTDFFDFVVTPEDMGGDIVLHNNFPFSRKSGGVLFGNNNNNTSINNNANTNSGSLCNGDSSEYRPVKETNNNHLLSNESASLPSFGDHTFWNTSASAKAAAAAAAAAALNINVKLESPGLEDLNDICWPGGTGSGSSQPDDHRNPEENNQRTNGKVTDNNTDGSIYTLTVVNPPPGTTATWYRPPENEQDITGILKGEDHLREAMSAMEATGQYHTSLDIDSIISILPSLPSMSDSLHEHNGFTSENHSLFNSGAESSTEVLRNDLLGSEKHSTHSSCDDSGFGDSKDDLQNRLKPPHAAPSVQSSPQPEGSQQGPRPSQGSQDQAADGGQQPEVDESRQQTSTSSCSFSENNNDWSFSNNETQHSAESLLRSALQGGKSFLSQYNGCSQQDKTLKCLDTHTELQQAVRGGHTTPDPASLGLYMTNDVDSPGMGMMPVSMDSGSVLLFDDTGGGMYGNNQGSTGSQSMDDILLSPLEDYEKFKLIEDEVAESAKRYGSLDPPVSSHVNGMPHSSSPLHAPVRGPAALPSSPYPPIGSMAIHEPLQPTQSSSPAKSKKKSSKKLSDRTSGGGGAKSKAASSAASASGTAAAAIASSNGARRERSLHHCTICSKAFKDKYSVNVHIRTHTGEKPFACSVCGKSFRQKAHLAKHYHTHVVQKTNEPLGSCKVLPTKTR